MRNTSDNTILHHNALFDDAVSIGTLIDSIPAQIAYIDCNMIMHYCNQPFKDCFSLDGIVKGKSFPLIAGRQVFDQVQRHMDKVLVGKRAQFEISSSRNDQWQYWEATLSPDFDDRGHVKGFIFHSISSTEKMRAQRELRDYFENASIGLHWVDANGIIIWANAAELALLGYDEKEYIGHHIAEFHADKDMIADILNRLKRNETLHSYEAQMLCRDGSTRYVSINSSVLWEGERFVHTRCFTIDITEQKLAEKALKESEEKFRLMANLVPVIIWTTDAKGDCDFLSIKWQEITGQPTRSGLDKQWLSFIHADDRRKISLAWSKSFANKKPFEARFRFLHADGMHRTIAASATPRYQASGAFEGYIGAMHDISSEEYIRASLEKIVLDRTNDLRKRNAALKEAEKALLQKNHQLEESNDQLSAFAHVASHDLQEPLRKIQVFINRLFELDGDNISEKGRDLFKRIAASSERMTNLIHDLLEYSQSSGKSAKAELVDLNVVLKEVTEELQLKIDHKGAKIDHAGLPCVRAIRFQLYQLFLNLIINALKFSRPDVAPVIRIQAQIVKGYQIKNAMGDPDLSYHHISISDNGIGFDSVFAERIFEMFQRLHSRQDYDGTGIGLSICKKIVQNHDGIITAEGVRNSGATFHIYLPCETHPLKKESI